MAVRDSFLTRAFCLWTSLRVGTKRGHRQTRHQRHSQQTNVTTTKPSGYHRPSTVGPSPGASLTKDPIGRAGFKTHSTTQRLTHRTHPRHQPGRQRHPMAKTHQSTSAGSKRHTNSHLAHKWQHVTTSLMSSITHARQRPSSAFKRISVTRTSSTEPTRRKAWPRRSAP